MTYVGAILAGGRGARMGQLGEQYPKALLPIANRPLVVHHLETLAAAGIREVLVVVGVGAEQVERVVGDGTAHGVRVTYVEQGAPLGSAHAAGRLANLIDGPFVLLLGDYYTAQLEVEPLLERAASSGSGVVLAKRERDRRALSEACVLVTDAEGRVQKVIEKPKSPPTDLKGCGVYVLPAEFFDSVRRTPRTALRDEYELMVSLDLFVRDGNPVLAHHIPAWDVNLTRPIDVLRCNLRWLDERKKTELVGANVRLAEGSRLQRVVIGDDVVIDAPCLLQDLVVFNGVQLSGAVPGQALATPGGLVVCA